MKHPTIKPPIPLTPNMTFTVYGASTIQIDPTTGLETPVSGNVTTETAAMAEIGNRQSIEKPMGVDDTATYLEGYLLGDGAIPLGNAQIPAVYGLGSHQKSGTFYSISPIVPFESIESSLGVFVAGWFQVSGSGL